MPAAEILTSSYGHRGTLATDCTESTDRFLISVCCRASAAERRGFRGCGPGRRGPRRGPPPGRPCRRRRGARAAARTAVAAARPDRWPPLPCRPGAPPRLAGAPLPGPAPAAAPGPAAAAAAVHGAALGVGARARALLGLARADLGDALRVRHFEPLAPARSRSRSPAPSRAAGAGRSPSRSRADPPSSSGDTSVNAEPVISARAVRPTRWM